MKTDSKAVKKGEKKPLFPKLRFPEFKTDGEWNKAVLGNVTKRLTSKVGSKKLTPVSITAGKGFVDQTKKFGKNISGAQYKSYIHIKRGDFSYNKGNSKKFKQGCVYQLHEFEEAAASTAFICFKLKSECVDGFYQNLFEHNAHGRELAKFITSGARSDGLLNINPTDFFSIQLPVPPEKAEQQKIADCLSSLDSLITAHSAKLAALQTHKQGLLQQLFPAEGQTTPTLRFPAFQKTEGWASYSINELVSKKYIYPPKDGNHGNIHPKASDYVPSGIPFVMANDLRGGRVNFSKCKHIRKSQADKLQKGFAKEGDVLITHKGTIGATALLSKIDYPYVMLTPQVTYYRVVNQSKNSREFLLFTLEADSFQNQMIAASGGGTRSYIGITEQGKLLISLPKSLLEQQKVADCLSSLDALITAQTEKVAALKAHKKGLMQQLFPAC